MSNATSTPPGAGPSQGRKVSNVLKVDFAKGRTLPGWQKPAGLSNDLVLHLLEQVLDKQIELTQRLQGLSPLLGESRR